MNLSIKNSKTSRKRTIVWSILIGGIVFTVFFMRMISSGGATIKADRPDNRDNRVKSKAGMERVITVTVQTPYVEKIQDFVEVTGSLRANQHVTLAPKISERISRILMEEGDHVKSGQLLVVLEDAPIRAQVAQAEAALKSASARLEQIKANKKIQDVQIQTRLEQAQADLAALRARLRQAETQSSLTSISTDSSVVKAETDLQAAQTALLQAEAQQISTKADLENAKERHSRRERLYNRGVISQEELTEAKRAVDVLQAQATIAEHNVSASQIRVRQAEVALALAKSNVDQRLISQAEVEASQERARQALSALHAAEVGLDQTIITAEDVKAAEAAVEQAAANLTYVREQLSSTRITAPFNGVISHRMANQGQIVSPITPLIELIALDTVFLEAEVSEFQVSMIHPGMPVQVTVDSLPGEELEAKVLTLIPVAQEDSRTFRIRIGLPKKGEFKPGSFGRGRIITREVSKALVIPKSSIVHRDENDVVFVVSDGKAKMHGVSLGVATQNGVEVLSGLGENDSVVILGAQMLQDGMSVKALITGNGQ